MILADVDNDGYADLVGLHLPLTQAYVYLGSMTGPALSPSATINQLDPGLIASGDVDGDDRDDLLFKDGGDNAYLFLSPASGVFVLSDAVSHLTLDAPGPDQRPSFGDLDQDGFDDLLVASGVTTYLLWGGEF